MITFNSKIPSKFKKNIAVILIISFAGFFLLFPPSKVFAATGDITAVRIINTSSIGSNSTCNPLYNITGSVTIGTFVAKEVVTQTISGAVGYLVNLPTGSATMVLVNITGSLINTTNTWVGAGGAIYTPSAAPVLQFGGCNGWVAEVDVSGVSAGGAYSLGIGVNNDPTNAKLSCVVTSLGYNTSGNATTISRTIYGTHQLRKSHNASFTSPYPNDETLVGSTLTLRIALSDFVYSLDTDVTCSVGAGIYTGSNATTGMVATNSSTLAYPRVIANWSWPGWTRINSSLVGDGTNNADGSFSVRAVGFQRQATNSKPLAAMVFTATDQHSNTVSKIVNDMTIDSTIADASKVQEYTGTFSTAEVNTLTQGDLITVQFKAYPWVGNSSAVMDTSDGVYSQPTPLYAPQYYVNDRLGTYVTATAVVDGTSGNDSTCVAVAQSAFNGTSDAATAGPCLTINKAALVIRTLNNTNGRGDAAGTIYMKAGNYAWSGAANTITGTANTWTVIKPFPGVLKASVVITSTSGNANIGSGTKVKFDGVTVNVASVAASVWTGFSYLWFNNSTMTSNVTATIYQVNSWYVTDSIVGAFGSSLKTYTTGFNPALVRGNNVSGYNQGINAFTVLGNLNTTASNNLQISESTANPNTLQPIIAYNKFYNFTNPSSPPMVLFDSGVSNPIGAAIIQNLFEYNGLNSTALIRIAGDSGTSAPVNNIMLWHNTLVGGRINRCYNDSGLFKLRTLWSEIGQLYDWSAIKSDTFSSDASRSGNWACLYSVGYRSNADGQVLLNQYNPEFAGLYSKYPSIATTKDAQAISQPPTSLSAINSPTWQGFVDRQSWNGTSAGSGNGNYSLTSGSNALNLIPAGKSVLPYDIDGNPRDNSGFGAAGAYEYIPPVTDITTAGVTGFTAPATLGTPQVFGNLIAGSAQYTVTGLTWSPTNNPFNAATAYTATVVLTSAATYKFPTGGIAVPTANGGGTVSAGTTSGGDVSGNTLTFTVLFPSTAAKITPTLSISNSPVTYNTSPQSATVSGSVAGVVSNIQYNGSGTTPTTAGTYAITADFAPTDSANYNSLTGTSAGNFVINTVNQGTLTAISTPSTVAYGTTATLSSSGGSGTGAVTFSVGASTGCNITDGTTLNISNPAGTCTITATKAADTNYNSATSAGLSVTLTKGTQTTLTVTGLPVSAVYQQAGISAGTSGGLGTGAVTFSAGVSTACSINSSTGAVTISASSGSCLITATKAADTNYNSATSGSVSIAVGTASQTITVTTPAPGSATYNGTFPVTATSNSGLTVAITTTGGCSITGGTVTMTSGTTACTVHYNQTGDSNYSAATEVTSVTTAVLANQGTLGGSAALWTLPTVPASGFKLNINSGALTTSNRNVTLNFSAGKDIKKIAISMTGDFTDASQEDYTSTKQLDLCSKFGGLIKNPTCPNGTYKVYAQFYTVYGRTSASALASSSITLTSGVIDTNSQTLPKYNFTRNLSLNMTGKDVKDLQQYLNKNGFIISEAGVGSPNNETNYFGSLTYKALVKFQKSLGWSGTGFFGPMTREYIKNK